MAFRCRTVLRPGSGELRKLTPRHQKLRARVRSAGLVVFQTRGFSLTIPQARPRVFMASATPQVSELRRALRYVLKSNARKN
jgi:hypothetical protein